MERYRVLFPIVKKYTYLNQTATGPAPTPATRAISKALRLWLGDEDPYEKWMVEFAEAKALFARLIGARSQEIASTLNTSMGVSVVAGMIRYKVGDNIVINDMEFPANVYPWLNQKMEEGERSHFWRSPRPRSGDSFFSSVHLGLGGHRTTLDVAIGHAPAPPRWVDRGKHHRLRSGFRPRRPHHLPLPARGVRLEGAELGSLRPNRPAHGLRHVCMGSAQEDSSTTFFSYSLPSQLQLGGGVELERLAWSSSLRKKEMRKRIPC